MVRSTLAVNLEQNMWHFIIMWKYKGLVASCHSFCLFFIVYIHTHIHSIHSSLAFTEFRSIFSHCCLLSSGPSLRCRTENWTRGRLTASWHATVWAVPHPSLSCAAPKSELCRTQIWAVLHPSLSSAAPKSELCHTCLSCAEIYCELLLIAHVFWVCPHTFPS